MAAVLHLFTTKPDALALETVRGQVAAGDRVTVVLVDDAGGQAPTVPGAAVHRVPAELGWDAVLDVIFAADQVVAW